jgi:hypothetical protein
MRWPETRRMTGGRAYARLVGDNIPLGAAKNSKDRTRLHRTHAYSASPTGICSAADFLACQGIMRMFTGHEDKSRSGYPLPRSFVSCLSEELFNYDPIATRYQVAVQFITIEITRCSYCVARSPTSGLRLPTGVSIMDHELQSRKNLLPQARAVLPKSTEPNKKGDAALSMKGKQKTEEVYRLRQTWRELLTTLLFRVLGISYMVA